MEAIITEIENETTTTTEMETMEIETELLVAIDDALLEAVSGGRRGGGGRGGHSHGGGGHGHGHGHGHRHGHHHHHHHHGWRGPRYPYYDPYYVAPRPLIIYG